MPFKLLDVDFEKDWDEVTECKWDSYENPLQNFFRLFGPVLGEGPNARKEAIKANAERQLAAHRSNPRSYWQKVVNDDGKIVGAALWNICHTNPFEGSDHSEAVWYPPGETREYVTECMQQFGAARARMATRPQVFLHIIFTHPDYRRQGVASLLLDWGTQKADEMGVEMWLDAGELGVPVYKKHGFVVVHETRVLPKVRENAGQAWKKIDAELQPLVFWQMWRPIGGGYKEGETVKPWE